MDILTLFAASVLVGIFVAILVIFNISYSVYRDMNNGGYRTTFKQFVKLYNSILHYDCVKYDTDVCFWHESIMYSIINESIHQRRNVIYLHASIVQIGDIKLIFNPIDFVRYCLWKKKEIKRLNTLKIRGEI